LKIDEKTVEFLFGRAVIKILPARLEQNAHEANAKVVAHGIEREFSSSGGVDGSLVDVIDDTEQNERIERFEYDGRADHAVIVEFAQVLDHGNAALIEFNLIYLHAQLNVLDDTVNDSNAHVFL
jgi:hypothetical protein